MEDLARNADRVFYFDEKAKIYDEAYFEAYPKAQKSQGLMLADRYNEIL